MNRKFFIILVEFYLLVFFVSFIVINECEILNETTINECDETTIYKNTIHPKIDYNEYDREKYNCVNFSSKAKKYFEGLGYNVSYIDVFSHYRNDSRVYHRFIVINEPVYIEPQTRKLKEKKDYGGEEDE
ncbi:MAG: hypothetical protein ACOC5T_07010 [Elusimicrobiota bacterium]